MVTVSELKAGSPYGETYKILWDAVNGKKVNGFYFTAESSLSSLTTEQRNAYNQAVKNLFAHPDLYLTAAQLKTYNSAMARANANVAARKARPGS